MIDCVVVVYVVCVCCGVVGMGTAQYRPLVGGLDLPYGRSTLVGWPVLRLPGLSTAQHTHIQHSATHSKEIVVCDWMSVCVCLLWS